MNTSTDTSTRLSATRPASSPAVHSLSDFNTAPAEQLCTLLTFMTACPELARTIVVGRPYRRVDDVFSAASRALHTLPTPLVRGIVDAHYPVDRVPFFGDAVAGGLLTAEETGKIAELREAALGYAAVQGHLFIADPGVWGSPEAVAMIPPDPASSVPVGTVLEKVLADVDARTVLPAARAWEITVEHLEESNRLKLVTLFRTPAA